MKVVDVVYIYSFITLNNAAGQLSHINSPVAQDVPLYKQKPFHSYNTWRFILAATTFFGKQRDKAAIIDFAKKFLGLATVSTEARQYQPIPSCIGE